MTFLGMHGTGRWGRLHRNDSGIHSKGFWFGSGWVWLVVKDNKLAVEKSTNAVNPLIWGHIPLLTIDVWEHAYYIDYQNWRTDYVSAFMDNLVSWDAVKARFGRAQAFANLREPIIPEL